MLGCFSDLYCLFLLGKNTVVIIVNSFRKLEVKGGGIRKPRHESVFFHFFGFHKNILSWIFTKI